MEKPNYYAIIPANVRYDNELTANAKLLFGEITALANADGYCWANNNYFSKLYLVQKETISRWISSLEKKGYINIKMFYEKDTKKITKRLIFLANCPIDKIINTPCENNQYPIDKIINTPIDKIIKDNNTSINNTSINNITPLPPLENFKEETNYKSITYEVINDWLIYKKEKKENYKEMGLKSLLTQIKNNIDIYGEEEVCKIIQESMASNYKGIIFNKLKKPVIKNIIAPKWFDKDL